MAKGINLGAVAAQLSKERKDKPAPKPAQTKTNEQAVKEFLDKKDLNQAWEELRKVCSEQDAQDLAFFLKWIEEHSVTLVVSASEQYTVAYKQLIFETLFCMGTLEASTRIKELEAELAVTQRDAAPTKRERDKNEERLEEARKKLRALEQIASARETSNRTLKDEKHRLQEQLEQSNGQLDSLKNEIEAAVRTACEARAETKRVQDELTAAEQLLAMAQPTLPLDAAQKIAEIEVSVKTAEQLWEKVEQDFTAKSVELKAAEDRAKQDRLLALDRAGQIDKLEAELKSAHDVWLETEQTAEVLRTEVKVAEQRLTDAQSSIGQRDQQLLGLHQENLRAVSAQQSAEVALIKSKTREAELREQSDRAVKLLAKAETELNARAEAVTKANAERDVLAKQLVEERWQQATTVTPEPTPPATDRSEDILSRLTEIAEGVKTLQNSGVQVQGSAPGQDIEPARRALKRYEAYLSELQERSGDVSQAVDGLKRDRLDTEDAQRLAKLENRDADAAEAKEQLTEIERQITIFESYGAELAKLEADVKAGYRSVRACITGYETARAGVPTQILDAVFPPIPKWPGMDAETAVEMGAGTGDDPIPSKPPTPSDSGTLNPLRIALAAAAQKYGVESADVLLVSLYDLIPGDRKQHMAATRIIIDSAMEVGILDNLGISMRRLISALENGHPNHEKIKALLYLRSMFGGRPIYIRSKEKLSWDVSSFIPEQAQEAYRKIFAALRAERRQQAEANAKAREEKTEATK